MFQSSPDPRGPGVPAGAAQPARPGGFNPRPTLAGRASSKAMSDRYIKQRVSILARPSRAGRPRALGRGMRDGGVSILARPSRAGRPGYSDKTTHWCKVSILARPSRAGRRRTPRRPHQVSPVSILARPSRAGRHEMRYLTGNGQLFQSSPDPRGPGVIEAPRSIPRYCAVSILARPSRAGRLLQPGECRAPIDVSILARPSRAGRHKHFIAVHRADGFQSSPDPRGPGVVVPRRLNWRHECFNPRPTLAGRASW